jgi:hypothetical protein
MLEAPDIRPLRASDISAANRRHDDAVAYSPWFRLWQRYGVCYRGEAEGGLRIQSSCHIPVERRVNAHTNQNMATSRHTWGTPSFSTDEGMMGRRFRYRSTRSGTR